MANSNNKFKINDSVFYPHLDKYGTVTSIINKSDPVDISLQGYRYEVLFDGKGTWSITESSLLRRKKGEKNGQEIKQFEQDSIAKT